MRNFYGKFNKKILYNEKWKILTSRKMKNSRTRKSWFTIRVTKNWNEKVRKGEIFTGGQRIWTKKSEK